MTMDEPVRHTEQSPRVALFVRNMRDLRGTRGWSAERLSLEMVVAGYAPIPRSTLTNLENSRRATLTLDEAFALVATLQTSLEWMCGYDGPSCTHCQDNPPEGFACLVCKADKDVRLRPWKEES